MEYDFDEFSGYDYDDIDDDNKDHDERNRIWKVNSHSNDQKIPFQVEKATNSKGDGTFQVITAPFPIELTPFYGLKERIQDKIIQSVKKKVKETYVGEY